MKICYLLESAELCGGVKVVFDQAKALTKQGHDVRIRALRGDHTWYPYNVRVDYVTRFTDSRAGWKPDVVIATFWTTVQPALQLDAALTFHFCQGYEGDIAEYAPIRSDIDSTYAMPVPKITVGPWLARKLKQRFGEEKFRAFSIGQIVDLDLFIPAHRWTKWIRRPMPKRVHILLVGLFESSVKGIRDGLASVSLLRKKGLEIYLTRVSTGYPSEEEHALTPIDEYHTNIFPRKMLEMYHRSDIFLAPSLAHEGFGLPFAEALACGVPSVATSIPSYLSFDSLRDYALFVPEHDPFAMAESAHKIIKDASVRRSLRRRGIEVVNRNFRSSIVAERLENIFMAYAK
jgi:glycosyltransferase involved in cell wall biosynthesis